MVPFGRHCALLLKALYEAGCVPALTVASWFGALWKTNYAILLRGRVLKPCLVRSPVALTEGESDLTQTGELMRFTISANMAGIPALSIPVGQSSSGAC